MWYNAESYEMAELNNEEENNSKTIGEKNQFDY